MAKMSAVVFGFILTLVVSLFFARYQFWGLLIVGLIVGYMAHEGVLGGMWNAALAGAFGTIISALLFVFLITVGGTAAMGLLGGLAGFTFSGIASLIDVVLAIIESMIAMGITGAIGGALSGREEKH